MKKFAVVHGASAVVVEAADTHAAAKIAYQLFAARLTDAQRRMRCWLDARRFVIAEVVAEA